MDANLLKLKIKKSLILINKKKSLKNNLIQYWWLYQDKQIQKILA